METLHVHINMETQRHMKTWRHVETGRHSMSISTWRHRDFPCPYPHGDMETNKDMETHGDIET